MRRVAILSVLIAASFAFLMGAFLDEGSTTGSVVPSPAPLPPSYDPCGAANALRNLASNVSLGATAMRYGVAVAPILRGKWNGGGRVESLEHALSHGHLQVRESDNASVPRLTVRNSGSRSVLIMSGEMLLGGKQNRLAANDFLVPPNSGWIDIPVFCGERNRWTGGGGFGAAKFLAPAALRSKLAEGATQSEVWDMADDELRSGGAESKTRDLSAVYERGDLAEGLRCLRRQGGSSFPGDTVGFVAMSGGRILGVEIYASENLFEDNWRKALESLVAGERDLPRRCLHGGWDKRIHDASDNRILGVDKRIHDGSDNGIYDGSAKHIDGGLDKRIDDGRDKRIVGDDNLAHEVLRSLENTRLGPGFDGGDACGLRLRAGYNLNGQLLVRNGDIIHIGAVGSPPVRLYKED